MRPAAPVKSASYANQLARQGLATSRVLQRTAAQAERVLLRAPPCGYVESASSWPFRSQTREAPVSCLYAFHSPSQNLLLTNLVYDGSSIRESPVNRNGSIALFPTQITSQAALILLILSFPLFP